MNSIIITSSSDADQRIDKFLKKYLPNAPLGGMYKWLRTGKIKVNRKKVEQTYRIEVGDVIDIYLHDEEMSMMRKDPIPSPTLLSNFPTLQLSILYEDEHFMVINKPAGINVHPGDHKTKEVSLIELVHDHLGETYNSLSFRPSLVHRIDRDTSGAILIAKDKPTLEYLLSLLQGGKIEKIYHALVVGNPLKPRDTIRAKLLRIEEAQNEAKVKVSPLGQDAVTHYQTIKANIRNKYSLLECRIETGRTHQIRVHLASIGNPILGDKSYGNRGENSFAKREYGITRQLLHARALNFIHPVTKKKLSIEAPYPKDIEDII